MVKDWPCQCRRQKRCSFDPWVGKIPWRKAWQPTPVFLPGESHGHRSLVGDGPQGRKEVEYNWSDLAQHVVLHKNMGVGRHPKVIEGPFEMILAKWRLHRLWGKRIMLERYKKHSENSFIWLQLCVYVCVKMIQNWHYIEECWLLKYLFTGDRRNIHILPFEEVILA